MNWQRNKSMKTRYDQSLVQFNLRKYPLENYGKFYQNQFKSNNYDLSIITKLLADIDSKMLQLGPHKEEFKSAISELNNLKLKSQIPNYFDYIANMYWFVVDYVEVMYKLLKSRDSGIPGASGTYHIDYTRGFLDALLVPGRNTRVYFSFDKIDYEYLLHVRPLCMHFVQLLKIPSFSDDALNDPSKALVPPDSIRMEVEGKSLDLREMTGHDLGHAHVMSRQDLWLFETLHLSPPEIIADLFHVKNLYLNEIEKLFREKDPELCRALKLYLFDVVHDRGYNYYLPIMKQQIESIKNLENLKRKIIRGDFNDIITPLTLSRIDEAGNILIEMTNRFMIEENRRKLKLYQSSDDNNGYRIAQYLKPQSYHDGKPIRILIENDGNIFVEFHTNEDNQMKKASLYEIELLNISPLPIPILNENKIRNINSIILTGDSQIILDKDGNISSIEKQHDNNDHLLSQKKNSIGLPPNSLKKIEIFKMERILGLIATNGTTNFTITSKPIFYETKTITFDSSNRNRIIIDSGLSFALNEIGIEKSKVSSLKYINKDEHARFISEKELRSAYVIYGNTKNPHANPFVEIKHKGNIYELGIVDTTEHPTIAKAVSSLLTRSVDDAKDESANNNNNHHHHNNSSSSLVVTRGKYKYHGYAPASYISRAQLEYVSPSAISNLWGKFGYRFVLTRKINENIRELIGTALIGSSKDNLFFFTHKYNNIKIKKQHQQEDHEELRKIDEKIRYSPDSYEFTGVDWNIMIPSSINKDLQLRWFDKFDLPDPFLYKIDGFNQLGNFAIEKINCRGLGLGKLLIDSIQKYYAIQNPNHQITHSQPLVCGKGLFQLADPSWKRFMKDIGFQVRLGAESFFIDHPLDPLIPTIINGQAISNIHYNEMFGLFEEYEVKEDIERRLSSSASEGGDSSASVHLKNRIPHVLELGRSGRAKLQYYQLFYPFH
jgi:hypothetical protein